MKKTSHFRQRYVVRPTDDLDCDEPRRNWDVCDTRRRDEHGFAIAIETHRTRKQARSAAAHLNAQEQS